MLIKALLDRHWLISDLLSKANES